MLQMLGGNKDSVDAFKSSVGKMITELKIDKEMSEDSLVFTFEDETKMRLYDAGQSCCESRYLHTDDDLGTFIGSKLIDARILDAPDATDDDDLDDVHEVEFLVVGTSKGVIVVETHNEHNGYYGGFAVRAQMVTDK